MPSSNPLDLNKAIVSRDAHNERVNRTRKEAYDIGFDIDTALAQNASAMRGTNTDAMLDRVFPGITQDDYDAFDSAEQSLRDSATARYTGDRSPFGAKEFGYDDLHDDDKFAVNMFGPEEVAERMFDERRANDGRHHSSYECSPRSRTRLTPSDGSRRPGHASRPRRETGAAGARAIRAPRGR